MRKHHSEHTEPIIAVRRNLAATIGLNEAIVVQQLTYEIDCHEDRPECHFEGRVWYHRTYGQWKERAFPFWSEKTIRRTFDNLIEKGIVLVRPRFKDGSQVGNWWTIEGAKIDEITRGNTPGQNDQGGVDKMTSPPGQNDQPRVDKMTSPPGQNDQQNIYQYNNPEDNPEEYSVSQRSAEETPKEKKSSGLYDGINLTGEENGSGEAPEVEDTPLEAVVKTQTRSRKLHKTPKRDLDTKVAYYAEGKIEKVIGPSPNELYIQDPAYRVWVINKAKERLVRARLSQTDYVKEIRLYREFYDWRAKHYKPDDDDDTPAPIEDIDLGL